MIIERCKGCGVVPEGKRCRVLADFVHSKDLTKPVVELCRENDEHAVVIIDGVATVSPVDFCGGCPLFSKGAVCKKLVLAYAEAERITDNFKNGSCEWECPKMGQRVFLKERHATLGMWFEAFKKLGL
jgi:hypothetical protein